MTPDPAAPDLPDPAVARLLAAAERYGFPLGAVPALVRYVEAVLAESAHVNLTGAKTLEAALDILALDALPVCAAWPRGAPPPRRAVDLGTGNGLPGVVVALAWPTCETVLVDRTAKKAAAVARCIAAVGLRNVEVLACDGREVLFRRPSLARAVDLVTVRAVADLAPTTKEAAPWLAPGGRIVHWKAFGLDPAERAAGLSLARGHGLRPLDDLEFRVPGAEAPRRLVVYERP